MKKLFCIVIVLIMAFGLVACQSDATITETASSGTAGTSGTLAGTSSGSTDVTYTDAGTPRAETLVISMINGQWSGEMIFNPYFSGCVYQGNGFRALVWEHLWDVDSSTGEQICVLAEDFPVAVDDTNTKFEVKLRQGVTWSDGIEFTADDLVFTSELLLSTPSLTYAAAFASNIKSITKVDDYTVLIETVKKEMRLSQILGVTGGDTPFRILPKHIWEKVDPLTYEYSECVGTGPYTLAGYDPNGNYFLFEKREDVENSASYMVYGEPTPKYVLFECFGTEETTVMAAINNQVDCLNVISMEGTETLLEQNSEADSWYSDFPYGRTNNEPMGIQFNCAVEPMDSVNVRWALTLALNVEDLTMASFNGGAKVDTIALSATDAMTETYTKPLVGWLESFTLSDGYQPFNSSYATEIAATLTTQGMEELPTDEEELIDMFGVGWWKYDTTEAESLLLAEGFSRGSDGMWLKPDGTQWQITITVKALDIQEKFAYAIVNAWNEFGIDAVVNSIDVEAYNTDLSQGLSDCYVANTNGSELVDATNYVRKWCSSDIAAVGENTAGGYTSGACARWASDEIDAVINKLLVTSDEERTTELITEYLKLMITDMPYCVVLGNKHIDPVTTHYWTGFPDSEDPYSTNSWWFSNSGKMLAQIQATANQ